MAAETPSIPLSIKLPVKTIAIINPPAVKYFIN